jgi:hypothetical protein
VSQDVSTTADRVQFGLISAVFGVVVGALGALVVLGLFAFFGHALPFNRWMVGFSAAFFFLVGFARGSEAAETVVDSFVTAAAVGLGAIGIAEAGGNLLPGDFGWRSSLWWTIAYFSGMVLLAWFA